MEQQKDSVTKRKIFSSRGQIVMLVGIILCIFICSIMFTVLGLHINSNTQETVDSIGEKTMSESSKQFTLHYEAVLKQRLTMVEAIVEDYKASISDGGDVDTAKDNLGKMAARRGFNYLGFLDVLGSLDDEDSLKEEDTGRTLDRIIDNNFIVLDLVPFRKSILKNEKKIAVGRAVGCNNDEMIVMFSFPTDVFTMSTGNKSRALVAGMSVDTFIDDFNINSVNKENTISYIVRNDTDPNSDAVNSLILKGENDEGFDYFSDLLKSRYSNVATPIQDVIDGLNESMREGHQYSNILRSDDQYIHIYCSKLSMSEWYLVSLTNNSDLKGAISDLNSQWMIIIVIAVVSIVVILAIVFLIYNYYNKRTMLQLEHARQSALDASKAKSEFLSNMSHDIRTPMNAIVGMTAIASANINNQAQVQDCLKKITLSSKHLLGLINDVLDMSKIESGKMTLNMEQISLREVLDGISTIVRPQIKIKEQKFDMFIHNIQTENVYCDSVRFNQILLNLLSNAIKFTPEHGSIEVSFRQEDSPLGEHYVRNFIDVKDTGIGMTPEFMAKVFESFTREDSARVHKTEGTGLGMTITKYIVDAMKGTINVSSELGKGSHFHIELDLERVEKMEEEMILPDWKMLVVDDDEQLCRTAVESLKSIGVRGEWTLSGEEAVKMTVKAHDTGDWYNIILLDWKLPGIDGIETARQIRKQLGSEIPILLISAYDWSDMEAEAREAGISGFISKPLFKSTLYYGLRKFIPDYADSASDAEQHDSNDDVASKHILIAEDNDLNWEIAEMLLEDAGMNVDRAENGKICVEMLKNSAHGTYDAILMDIRMPVMTGYEATVAIRALDHPDKDIPIIAMTADAFADDMKKCLDCGMNAHIPKPIDMNLLKITLKKFMK